jgi:hypothetical protein
MFQSMFRANLARALFGAKNELRAVHETETAHFEDHIALIF